MKAKRQKILITTDFAAPHRNGVAQVVTQIANSLSDYDVTILTYAQPGAPERETNGHITTVRIAARRLLGDTLRVPRESAKLPKHDLVITNTRFFTLSAVGMSLAKKWHVPRIHLEHGNRHVPHHNPIVRFGAWGYDHSIGRAVISRANIVVCIARAGLPFARKLGARKVALIPNGIDAQKFKVAPTAAALCRQELGIKANGRMVLSVGRLVKEKGVQDLITALSDMPQKAEGWTLVIIGAGPMRERFETQAARSGVRALFLGEIPPEQLPPYYKAADVFVNPSWAEGLPTTVLEALTSGTKVIATAVGGTAEILPRASLVRAKAPSELRKSLEELNKLPAVPLQERFTLSAMRASWRTLVASVLNSEQTPKLARNNEDAVTGALKTRLKSNLKARKPVPAIRKYKSGRALR